MWLWSRSFVPYSCPVPYLEKLSGNFSLKTRLSVWNGLSWERHCSCFSVFWKQILQKNKIGENALFYCFGESFLFSVSFFIGNKKGCFQWHFLRWKAFLREIIGVFQLPPYESPINSNPAAGAINPCFCTLAKLYWNQWSAEHDRQQEWLQDLWPIRQKDSSRLLW